MSLKVLYEFNFFQHQIGLVFAPLGYSSINRNVEIANQYDHHKYSPHCTAMLEYLLCIKGKDIFTKLLCKGKTITLNL